MNDPIPYASSTERVKAWLDGAALHIRFSNPARHNALGAAEISRLRDCLGTVATDPALRVLLLTGMLVGFVYVDMDAGRKDVGSYVEEAKRAVAQQVKLPAGYFLKWTGQYELLEKMNERLRVVIPLTLIIIVILN